MINIIIPTCKPDTDLLVQEIQTYSPDCEVILSYGEHSASVNRNAGLNKAKSDIVIMCDDDLCGFYNGWVTDLVSPLEDKEIVMVSARLMNSQGFPGNMMCINHNCITPVVDVAYAPTACCAFRNDGLRFCEEYKRSGYEDTHFIMDLRQKYGQKARVVVSNKCRITHFNEMKGQVENLSWNQSVFVKHWGRLVV